METYEIIKNKDGHIGYALIINNAKFKPTPREGSEKDVENVKKSFERLHFKTADPLFDLTAKETRNKIARLADKEVDFSQYSCFVCVVMSLGNGKDRINAIDSKTVNLDDDIIGPFRDCEKLRGKPKLFLVQACRGNDDMLCTIIVDDDDLSLFDCAGREEADVSTKKNNNSNDKTKKSVSVKEADVLVHCASKEQFIIKRNILLGSCYVSSLCFVLNNYAANEALEIKRLIKMINRLVVHNYKCQTPEICKNTLSKEFYFTPSVMSSLLSSDEQAMTSRLTFLKIIFQWHI
jgi:hypothetical protein